MRGFIFLFSMASMLLCACSATQGLTQTKAAEKYVKRGDDALAKDDIDRAKTAYLKSIDIYPDYVLPRMRLAGIHFQAEEWSASKKYFMEVLELEANQHQMIWYKLAQIAWIEDDFPSVVACIDSIGDMRRFAPNIKKRAKKYRRDATFHLAHPTEGSLSVAELPSTINSPHAEALPALDARGDMLVFTRRWNNQEDFFVSQKKDGEWSTAVPLRDLNTDGNEGAHALSADGKLLIFTACERPDRIGSCDLYFSVRKEKGWSSPRNLGDQINSKAWDSQPSISADGRTLYFASERGGKGGRDLWWAKRTKDGWTKPQNLASINTPEDEQAPFIHHDNSTLYFMSDGHPGYGGTDLFLTQKQGDKWSPPRNLLMPVNSKGDEGALYVDPAGTTGYFARAEAGHDRSDLNLYQMDLPVSARPHPSTYLTISVVDAATQAPLRAIVDVFDLKSEQTHTRAQTYEDGALLACIRAGTNYAIHVAKTGYVMHSEHVRLDTIRSSLDPFDFQVRLHRLPVETTRAEKREPVVLHNVFFASGAAELLPESMYELKKLLDLLRTNETLSMEIHGHTDDVGTDEDNRVLSEARAKAVYDYLIDRGVDTSRLGYQGFGESRPTAPNDTEEGRQKNRRTEFVITNK